jgi:hypothetical protein
VRRRLPCRPSSSSSLSSRNELVEDRVGHRDVDAEDDRLAPLLGGAYVLVDDDPVALLAARYRSYLFQRFSSPTRWTGSPWARGPHPGPAEEAIATWREVEYARRKKPTPPRGYQGAASKLADASPPGYNAWRCADAGNAHLAGIVTAAVVPLIANEPHVAPFPHGLDAEDFAEVPIYWRGDPAQIPAATPAKDFTRPTPARLESWLKKNKTQIMRERGKGSHVRFNWRGQTGGFSTSRDPVLKEPCTEIARIFGFNNQRAFYLAVAANRVVA